MLRDLPEDKQYIDIDINEIIPEVIDKYLFRLKDKSFTLDINIPSVKIRGNRLLEEHLGNIVENSINHSQGDMIKISCKERENDIILSIEDNGIGLQNQETDEIFSPLISSWDPPGTGMGLFRVKQIVDAMKGQIKITKGSKLKGVLAYIEIPPSGGGTTKMFD